MLVRVATFQICMRSRRSVLQRLNELVHWRDAARARRSPRTATFVAMKYLSRFLSSASGRPTTLSAFPYECAVLRIFPPSSGKSA